MDSHPTLHDKIWRVSVFKLKNWYCVLYALLWNKQTYTLWMKFRPRLLSVYLLAVDSGTTSKVVYSHRIFFFPPPDMLMKIVRTCTTIFWAPFYLEFSPAWIIKKKLANRRPSRFHIHVDPQGTGLLLCTMELDLLARSFLIFDVPADLRLQIFVLSFFASRYSYSRVEFFSSVSDINRLWR